jgi:hypothetical protein
MFFAFSQAAFRGFFLAPARPANVNQQHGAAAV